MMKLLTAKEATTLSNSFSATLDKELQQASSYVEMIAKTGGKTCVIPVRQEYSEGMIESLRALGYTVNLTHLERLEISWP